MTVDAGEIGSGHTVTALYEIKLHRDRGSGNATLATLRLRYRPRGTDEPVELEEAIRVGDLERRWTNASPSLRLAALVAEFAEILKGTYWAKNGDLRDVLQRAQRLSPEFAGDTRVADFVSLVAAASEIVHESER
jgi:Ca-activated chloride channel family protein